MSGLLKLIFLLSVCCISFATFVIRSLVIQQVGKEVGFKRIFMLCFKVVTFRDEGKIRLRYAIMFNVATLVMLLSLFAIFNVAE